MTEQIKKEIIGVIDSSHNAMVCSIDENGFPNAKTLTLRKMRVCEPFGFLQIYLQFTHSNG
jgi:hypothetical protein